MSLLPLPPKTWIYFCCHSKDLWISGAWVNLGYGASFFASIFDLRANRKIFDESFLMVPELQLRVPEPQGIGPRNWKAQASSKSVNATCAVQGRTGSIDLTLPKAGIDLSLTFDLLDECLQVRSSFESRAPGFTEKTWGQIRSGTVTLRPTQNTYKPLTGDAQLKVDLSQTPFALDFTRSHLPRHTQWRWALILDPMCNLASGNHLGAASENATLFENSVLPLPQARFDIPSGSAIGRQSPWKIHGQGIDLRFEPRFCHLENRNWAILKTHFEQWVGVFEGTVETMGQRHVVNKAWGVAEKQNCKW